MPSGDSTLTPSEYRALLRDVKKLAMESKKRPADSKVSAFWSIGQRIRSEHLSEGAGYGKAIVKDLAADVGLDERTLYDSIRFFDTFKQAPEGTRLSWTHHRVLLRVPSKRDRDFYIQKIEEEDWSSRTLAAAITAGLHLGKDRKLVLTRPSEPDYLYGAEILSVVDGDTLDLQIDLGFGVYRKLRARLAAINSPEIDTKAGRAARDFVAQELMSAQTSAVQTIRVDLHGRYVVHLFYARRRISTAACFKSGTHLNDLLVQKKHAKVVV